MDVSGHSLKRTFKHKYARQILAVNLISHCQTKECFNIGHSCIIIADPYIMSSLPRFAIWDGGKRQSCQYLPGERHNSSRQQQKANIWLTQRIKEHNSQEKTFIFQPVVDCRRTNAVGSVLSFTRQHFTKAFYSLKHILVGKISPRSLPFNMQL